jgi:putative membrane protein
MRLIIDWLISAVCIILIAMFVPGFAVSSFVTALIAAAVIGLLNATLGFLLKIITLPLGILTLGLFFLVINAIMLELASKIVPGFYVKSFGAAFIGAIILAILHMLLGGLSSSKA